MLSEEYGKNEKLLHKIDDDILKNNSNPHKSISRLTETIEIRQTIMKNLWIRESLVELNTTQSVNDLIAYKSVGDIYYGEILMCFEWGFKRLKILLRDGYRCKCGKTAFSNHVHHTYYVKNRLSWDIDDEALETLCVKCHEDVHNRIDIPVKIENERGELVVVDKYKFVCNRCGGHGYLPQFKHVLKGICFKCWGHEQRNETFRGVLQDIYTNKIVLRDEKNRAGYKVFFNSITYEYLLEKVPEFEIRYDTEHYYVSIDNDLPF